MASSSSSRTNVATLVGWALTLLALVWQVAVKDATYSLEIKTDLVWIRQQLQDNAIAIRGISERD